jgi:hypothetical protein
MKRTEGRITAGRVIAIVCIVAFITSILIYIAGTFSLHEETGHVLTSSLCFAFWAFSSLPYFIRREVGPDALSRRILTGYAGVLCGGAVILCLTLGFLLKDINYIIQSLVGYIIMVSVGVITFYYINY